MATARCPTCEKPFVVEKTKAVPFCSERCQLVDLGRWLDERNSVPVDPLAEADESQSRGLPGNADR